MRVFLDLEDAVAPSAKAQARVNAAAALTGAWGGRLLAVRVNDATTATSAAMRITTR
jgi:citrate lyase subunit beta / citryl-CoA lyase